MTESGEAPNPSDQLSDALIERLDGLEISELKAVVSYAQRRIESIRTPLEDEIRATASGDVLEIENHGAYAIVRKHPDDPDGDGAATHVTSMYHVQRTPHPDGEETLEWRFLGDVHDSEQARCDSCGGTIVGDTAVCPHCGSEQTEESGED
ncbi:hypothetical protein L593_05420 [Salinarchaeum sp. Harcht-Bsk1]|uniref:hypothetical protein n=1 Tax=Salinarchaeum sp. Harcht-Bsk1 TaxID=1333523 RepID=UPI0003422F76|nr:hypothetical protein [Salinarchaeum sp. Harcht-Bsk1]AGN01033.1 hypothetical protein L593_05420 [Salinarchaeum sp. Harcht-Bsk1]